jgi:DNA-binding XRE family transcriptional regulator
MSRSRRGAAISATSTADDTSADKIPLAQARRAKIPQMTQTAVAEAVGLEQSTYSRIESGEMEPRVGLARRIAGHLGIPLDRLEFPGEGKTPARRPPAQRARPGARRVTATHPAKRPSRTGTDGR